MNKFDDYSSHHEFDEEIDEVGDDRDEALMGEFLERWEIADELGNKDTILKEYCAKYPRLEGYFRDLAEVRGGVNRVVFVAAQDESAQLGPYKILRLLAYGGMGKVYEAEDELLPRRVAVKTIRIGREADRRLLEQFEAEREALARLHNTNIVPIYGAGEDNGLLYFAMPLINGLTLADLLETMNNSEFAKPETAASPNSPSSWVDLLKLAKSEASQRQTRRKLSARFGVPFSRASSPRPSSKPEPRTQRQSLRPVHPATNAAWPK